MSDGEVLEDVSEACDKSLSLLVELMAAHENICVEVWAGSMSLMIAMCMRKGGCSREDYLKTATHMVRAHERLWDLEELDERR
jgi:hypothetical protein